MSDKNAPSSPKEADVKNRFEGMTPEQMAAALKLESDLKVVKDEEEWRKRNLKGGPGATPTR